MTSTPVITLNPEDPADIARWDFSRRIRAMLDNEHRAQVEARIEQSFGLTKASEYGRADLTCNILEGAADALSALYKDTPGTSNSEGDASDLLRAVEQSGHWARMQVVQRDTMGMREHFLLQDMTDGGDPFTTRVFSDQMVAEGPADAPDQPWYLKRVVYELNPKTERTELLWDQWDVRDPDKPSRTLLDAKGDAVKTVEGPEFNNRWRDDLGPFIPGTMYHARLTGHMWDPYAWQPLYEGTLVCSVLWTFWLHCVREASWPQKWGMDVEAPGKNAQGQVLSDPASILGLKTNPKAPEGVKGSVGQFQAGADPGKLFDALAAYERRVASLAGLNPADVHRISGDPRSGYGLEIKRDGLRLAQAQWEGVFRRSDVHALGVWARLWNKRFPDRKVPVTGYNVRYRSIKLSPGEQEAAIGRIERLRQLGLTNPKQDLILLNPGMTDDEAEAQLATYGSPSE